MNSLLLGHEVDRPAGHDRDDEGIQERPVVGRDDERARRPGCARARSGSAGSRGGRTAAGSPVATQYTSGLTPRPRARSRSASRSMPWIRAIGGRGYSSAMPIDRARTARGALAGVIAAGAWSAQAQLDMRAFGVDYSDEALLGKAVTRGPAWPAVGFALHLLNGAAFGAAYTNIAPRLPLPSWARGPAAGDDRAPHDVAGDRRRRPRPPRAQRAARTCGATAAPSPRPPGATWCSASSSASSSAASTRPTTPACRRTSRSSPPTATATSSTPSALRRRRRAVRSPWTVPE